MKLKNSMTIIMLVIVGIGLSVPPASGQSLPAIGTVTLSAPSEGVPGTNAPADAAPLSAATSAWMSNEPAVPSRSESSPLSVGAVVADQVNTLRYGQSSGPSITSNQIDAEAEVRQLGTRLGRDLLAARARGVNIGVAIEQQRLGEISLAKGYRNMAAAYFRNGEEALAQESAPPPTNHAVTASLDPSGAQMNPNNGAIATY